MYYKGYKIKGVSLHGQGLTRLQLSNFLIFHVLLPFSNKNEIIQVVVVVVSVNLFVKLITLESFSVILVIKKKGTQI